MFDLFVPAAPDWEPPREFPRLPLTGRVGIDTETRDVDIKKLGPGWMRPGFRVVGVSIAVQDGPAVYIPLAHEGGQNVADPPSWRACLRDWAENFHGELVGLNIQYDLLALATIGVEFPLATISDVGVSDGLIDERHLSYSLKAVAARWGVEGKDETQLREAAAAYGEAKNPAAVIYKMAAGQAALYAIRDAQIPLEVLQLQAPVLKAQELGAVWALEQRVTPALVAMTRRGVRVDLDRLDVVEQEALDAEARVLKEIHDETGVDIAVGDVWGKAPLLAALKAIGVTPDLTPSGKKRSEEGKEIRPVDHEIKQYTLEDIDHPVALMILKARQLDKISSTFAKSIRKYQVDGRVHCTFNQLRGEREDGSRAGAPARTSCRHPNLQQQPIRTSDTWRSIYIPEEGERWVKLDWAAQELRIIVHFAEVSECLGGPGAADMYRSEPGVNLFRKIAERMGYDYKRTKNGAYAVSFGAGLARLAATIDERDDHAARRFKRRLYNTVPFLKQLFDQSIADVRSEGYVRTPLGRRIRFRKEDDGSCWQEHKALANLVSPTGADQAKESIATMHEEWIPARLFVHDEFNLSVPEDSDNVSRAREIMERADWTTIPFVAEATTGANWGECK